VLYEAFRGHRQGKHIPLLLPPLTAEEAPPPYPAFLNVILHRDLAALKLALVHKGIDAR
jgi:hypothetical protein